MSMRDLISIKNSNSQWHYTNETINHTRNQLQQSVVLPVRTTPLTVQTPQSSGLPITQVIQNPTIQVASGGNISSTSSGSINATLGNQLPQQPSSIQNHVPTGTIQTVKIAGQTQVN